MAFILRGARVLQFAAAHYYSYVEQFIILMSSNLLFVCSAIGLERALSRACRVGRPDGRPRKMARPAGVVGRRR
jgi:hypothetical protein